MTTNNELLPNEQGFFGEYGGAYVAEILIDALEELTKLYLSIKDDQQFQSELIDDLKHYVGRPSPLYEAKRLAQEINGPRILLKREDLNHTGAHKINNTIGQIHLAKRMGKNKIIAETGAGQHGVATATVAARMGFGCRIYMGAKDAERQSLNVYRMKLLGAEVIPVTSGSQTLKDAMNEAMRYWVANLDDTHYIVGSAAGPHPYPMMVRDFQSIIGKEAKQQCIEQFGKKPNILVACVGGGSNAMGLFDAFVDDKEVQFVGVEAAGKGLETGLHAAPLNKGSQGVLHGSLTYIMCDSDGQIIPTHSISAGLDYPGIGPQHAYFKDVKRAIYPTVTDEEAVSAFKLLNKTEGILPALESSHALAWVIREAAHQPKDHLIIVNLSGRGDKDVAQLAKRDGIEV